MSRLVKIVDNKYVQIEEYRNPNICFNTNEYNDFEDYCTLRETFDPFEMFYENQELKKQLEENKDNYNCLLKQKEQFEYIMSKQVDYQGQQKDFIKYLEDEFTKIQNDIEKEIDNNVKYFKVEKRQAIAKILQKYKSIIGVSDENNKLKIQISARETLCEEYEQLINTILNFSFFKEECPLNFSFEDNSKEDESQNIFYNDEYCENNCNGIYKDCWLKYFKELQKTKGDVKNEN